MPPYTIWAVVTFIIVSTLLPSGISTTETSCDQSSAKSILNNVSNLVNRAKELCSDSPYPPRYVDCEELLVSGKNKSGIYTIWPRSRVLPEKGLDVYCDMETDNGGWTVIQRRGNYGKSKDFFFKNWEEYKTGFGDIGQDFWLGNDNIYAITNQRQYSLRFDLENTQGEKRYAAYDTFWVDNADYNYKLHVKGYSGTAGDSFLSHSGNQFSTVDRDNDKHETNCAEQYKGGWWYAACHVSNLNGLYLNGFHTTFADGVEWKSWTGYNYSLPFTEMKVRRTYFRMELPQPR